MLKWTPYQLKAIGLIGFLLLTGWIVKAWRTAHPPTPAAAQEHPNHATRQF